MSHGKPLFTLSSAGDLVPATAEEIIASAREHLTRRLRRGSSLSSPETVRAFLAMKLGAQEFESFCILFLDNRHRLIEFVELFRGTIDRATVHPREVVREALARNAAALILAHPHPSGVAEISPADQAITAHLKAALALIEVRVLDHCLVAGGHVVSMAELGLL
ncbi:MAG: DNA repair protein RadC [Gammaproteobacteria bacterium]|jgi:DNA repair protein RadC|nr:MAG: DNA repair protein RadC [Gammaproteobacteria bacterium]